MGACQSHKTIRIAKKRGRAFSDLSTARNSTFKQSEEMLCRKGKCKHNAIAKQEVDRCINSTSAQTQVPTIISTSEQIEAVDSSTKSSLSSKTSAHLKSVAFKLMSREPDVFAPLAKFESMTICGSSAQTPDDEFKSLFSYVPEEVVVHPNKPMDAIDEDAHARQSVQSNLVEQNLHGDPEQTQPVERPAKLSLREEEHLADQLPATSPDEDQVFAENTSMLHSHCTDIRDVDASPEAEGNDIVGDLSTTAEYYEARRQYLRRARILSDSSARAVHSTKKRKLSFPLTDTTKASNW